MNVYLVKRTDEPPWDSYIGFVAFAETANDALNIDPYGSSEYGDDCYDFWTSKDNLKAEYLGLADHQQEAGIILSSFKAA